MDQQDLEDWRQFCAGNSSFSPDHFSSLFMELYLEPLSTQDKAELQTIFDLVPNSTRALEKMFRMDEAAPSKSPDEIKALVQRDLQEIRPLLESVALLAAIDAGVITITQDDDYFGQAQESSLHRRLLYELAAFFIQKLAGQDVRLRAISSAFYGLASNQRLEFALTADLLPLDINFDNYFEAYLIGVDYAVTADEVVVIDYRAKYGVAI